MLETSRYSKKLQRAIIVGVQTPDMQEGEAELLLAELRELVRTLGFEIASEELVFVRQCSPGLFIGKGKAEDISSKAKALECDVIIFDNELTPAQQRNWETLSKLVVVDRQGVILDIFADRAHTREAVLQVELARQEYFLPRLKNAWTHLERQRGGGVTSRGVGEKQIEMDSRLVRDRIAGLKRELKQVVLHREVQRTRRVKVPLPTAAIVGYTNAGKSSLLNKLTGANAFVEDKLFATLDPTTRRLQLPNGQILLVTDTVGFVRRLPHRLVEAFKATLEEAVVADFLIHVVDISSSDLEEHMATTMKVMDEIGALGKPIVTVFNKIDLVERTMVHNLIEIKKSEKCYISIKTGEGFPQLLSLIEQELEEWGVHMELLIPHDRYDIIHKLHEMGGVKREEVQDDGVFILGNVPKRMVKLVEQFKVE